IRVGGVRFEIAPRAGVLAGGRDGKIAAKATHIVARIEMIVAAAHRGADEPILEFEEGGVSAGHPPRGIEHLATAAHAAQHAAADRAQEIEMMRALPPEKAGAPAGGELGAGARA